MNSNVWIVPSRRKAVWGPKRTLAALFLTFIWLAPSTAVAKPHNQQGQQKHAGVPGSAAKSYKVDRELESRGNDSRNQLKTTRVIVTFVPGATLPKEFKRFVAHFGNDRNTLLGNNNNDDGGKLNLINGQVLDLPNGVIKKLAAHPSVFRLHYDRPTAGHNYRTAVTVGARAVQDSFGYSGAGVGIAIIDSGITSWHDDLTNTTSKLFPYGNQRVDKFVDFVNGRTLPYDDNGHGSHVAGIIGGNGYDSFGEKRGIAPRASLISLKVLDQDGRGTISNIIAALGWVAQNAATYHIRVVNMSVGAGVHESYWTDPLTLACKALTDQGIVVVAAAGNLGKNAAGALQWGGITAPGNAPWVLTVGASSTMGTLTRSDDQMAGYSSSGPTHLDYDAKPDLVAPGTGTVSLAVPGSTFYANKAPYLLSGSLLTGFQPYLSLSGTSMAAPVVSGTVALMLQANPNLTPNLVKAILQYTAEQYAGYSALRQGAGFLNSLGAVGLAWYYKYSSVAPPPGLLPSTWSRQIIWGNHRVKGGFVTPAGNAWGLKVLWGAAKTDGLMGDNIVWGTTNGDNVVWGTSIIGDNVTWGTADGDNVVWGTDCGGADCDNIVWGTIDTAVGDNIVWGTAALGDNIIWGTALGDPMLGDNIVWGTSGTDVTWGSSAEDAPVYPDDASEPLPSVDLEFGNVLPLAPVVTPTTQLGPIGGVL